MWGAQNNSTALLRDNTNQIHTNQIAGLLNTVLNMQGQQELQYLINFLSNQQAEIMRELDECNKNDGVTEYDEQSMREVKDKCLKLKKNN